jgi:hypothetical protein
MGILGNDSAMDAYYGYMDLYNAGTETASIRRILEEKHRDDFDLNRIADNADFWLGLALAQWECKALDADVLSVVKRIIEQEVDQDLWGEDYPKRKAVLGRFLAKICKEKKTAKKRVPPKLFAAPFKKGDCVAFRFPDGRYGGAICLGASEGLKKVSSMILATTRLCQVNIPTVDDILSSHVLKRTWGDYKGEPDIVGRCLGDINSVEFNGKTMPNLSMAGNVPIEKLFANSFYGYCYGWDFARDLIHQFSLEKGNPNTQPDLSLPVRVLLDIPADGDWAHVGQCFVEAEVRGRPWEEHLEWCRRFVIQLGKMKLQPDSGELRQFLARYCGCSDDNILKFIRQACRDGGR